MIFLIKDDDLPFHPGISKDTLVGEVMLRVAHIVDSFSKARTHGHDHIDSIFRKGLVNISSSGGKFCLFFGLSEYASPTPSGNCSRSVLRLMSRQLRWFWREAWTWPGTVAWRWSWLTRASCVHFRCLIQRFIRLLHTVIGFQSSCPKTIFAHHLSIHFLYRIGDLGVWGLRVIM